MTKKSDTATSTRIYLVVFIAALVALGGSSWVATGRDRVTGLEHEWLLAINNGLPARLVGFMKIATLLGSLWAAAISVAAAYFARVYRLAWRLALSVLTTYGLAMLLAHLIQRPRPIGPLEDLYVRAAESGFGFPSMHAALITVVTLTLIVYAPKKWWWTAALPIVLVGISRLYLGVHAPLDIAGGLALGAVVVMLFRILPARVREVLRLD